MKISIVVFGTRGDVQPSVAVALGLISAGYEVVLCVPPEHESWVAAYGCPIVPFGPNVREMVKKGGEKSGKPATRVSVKTMKEQIIRQMDLLPEIIAGSDLLIGVGLVHGVPAVAEKMKIPYRFMAFYPGIMGPPVEAPFPDRLVWGFGKWATNASIRSVINRKRISIGLRPIPDVWTNWMGENVILASEKSLIPVSQTVDYRFTQTGYPFLPSLKPLTAEVKKFLASGTAPIFIGFGSNPISRPERFGSMMTEVAHSTGKRLLISKGWGAIGSGMQPDNCLFVDEVPFDLLFPHVAMVIHHGGIGTLAAAAKAGVPQAAFPFMADQFMNRKELVRLGLSPQTTSFGKLSAKILTRVIEEGLAGTGYCERASEIAREINECDGTDMTVKLIEGLLKDKKR